MKPSVGRVAGAATVAAVLGATGGVGLARADVVDDAFARGNTAVNNGDWAEAIAAYEQTRSLLPGDSAVLEYDLGTAYAHDGQLGRATYHLQRSLRLGGSGEVIEAARRNAGIVRRRAELQATAGKSQISPPEGWRDRLGRVFAAPALGWTGIVLGWVALGLLGVRFVLGRRRGEVPAILGPILIALVVAFVGVSAAHGLALRRPAEAVILVERAPVRDGPGAHREPSFHLQGGSVVRVVEEAPGWVRVRVKGGLVGWVRSDGVARLDSADERSRPSARSAVSASQQSPSL